jgi:hypothetical protein
LNRIISKSGVPGAMACKLIACFYLAMAMLLKSDISFTKRQKRNKELPNNICNSSWTLLKPASADE